MFKRRIIDWKLNKNYKSAEREAVAQVVERYKECGQPTPPILLHGQPVKMHRIQRHCKIGRSVTDPFGSTRHFDSSVLENHNGQVQPGGRIGERNKEIYLTDDVKMTSDNLQKMAALFTVSLRQLSPPHELKHAEFVIFQTNTFYEWFAQSEITPEMKGNITPRSQADIKAQNAVNPGAFSCKVDAALLSLNSNQPRAGWRLLHEATGMIGPMLASKHPSNLKIILRMAWEWEVLSPPDLYKLIWGQISESAPIILGESDPFSKVCLAVTHIKSKKHLCEIVVRLIKSIFERTLGPYNYQTMQIKSDHVDSLMFIGDFAGAECLQRMLLSDFKQLKDERIRDQEVAYKIYGLGCILKYKGDFTGAKKVFRDALNLGRIASEERFPTQTDIYCIEALVLMLAEDEYIEGEILLQEVLEKCLNNEDWGRYDWHTVSVLGSLEKFLKRQEKFHEAEMLRLQYPEAF